MKNHIIISLLFLSVGFCQQIIHTETYDNGNIKSISYHKKTRNGIEKFKEELYYENGQKKREEIYKEGKRDGLWTTWYEDGQKKLEGKYKNFQREGLWTFWYKHGIIDTDYEGNFRKDEYGNNIIEYENNEYVEYKGEVGKKDDGVGSFLIFFVFEDIVQYHSTTKNDKNIGEYRKFTEWFEHGQKSIELNYKNGKQHGTTIQWYFNGKKEFVSTYNLGIQEGLSIWYTGYNYVNIGNYKDGKMVGVWTRKKGDEIIETLNCNKCECRNTNFGPECK